MTDSDFDFGFIYVLRHIKSGVRKIGKSGQPEKRCRDISRKWGPCELEYTARCPLTCLPSAEKHAHALLWDKRCDNEWFNVDLGTAMRAVIASITAARHGEELWEPIAGRRCEMIATRCPDNQWREVDLLRP